MQRRRRLDQVEDRIVELETRLSVLSGFTSANDASLAEEVQAILDLLPSHREARRAELKKRESFRCSNADASRTR
jgi:hypothetical protein